MLGGHTPAGPLHGRCVMTTAALLEAPGLPPGRRCPWACLPILGRCPGTQCTDPQSLCGAPREFPGNKHLFLSYLTLSSPGALFLSSLTVIPRAHTQGTDGGAMPAAASHGFCIFAVCPETQAETQRLRAPVTAQKLWGGPGHSDLSPVSQGGVHPDLVSVSLGTMLLCLCVL